MKPPPAKCGVSTVLPLAGVLSFLIWYVAYRLAASAHPAPIPLYECLELSGIGLALAAVLPLWLRARREQRSPVRDATAEQAEAGELRRSRNELDRQVRERTAELESTNRALYEGEELSRRLFEDSPIGTVLAGLDGKIVRANRAFCDLLGYSAAELSTLTFDDITQADDVRANQEWHAGSRAAEVCVSQLGKRCVRKEGKIVWVNLTVSVIRDGHGNPLRVLAMAEDVSGRVVQNLEISRLNRELEARDAELTAVTRESDSFNYSVAHDLRAPLRHIDGFSEALLEEQAAGRAEETRRCAERIRESARRMGRMVDELLELSRTSRRKVSRRITGLRSLVEDALEELKPGIRDREIEWRIGDLPFADCDPALTRQVFAKLLANAVKFTRHRGSAVIEVGQTQSRGQTALFVRDNGVGFNMKYADRLFGVFQRLHRPEDFEGNGIGLITVQRILRKHGGTIWVEAELEKGATFYFTLEPPTQPEQTGTEQAEVLAGGKENAQ